MTETLPPLPPLAGQAAIPVRFPEVGATLRSARGEYMVRSIIGSGEFGAVYGCVGPFDQAYAVKMMRPANRPYAEVREEWLREVQHLLSLRHPNVVYIFDAFEDGHLFYLALERCDYSLTSLLGHPLREGFVIEIARQLLAAIQYLHDNDVVHDDLHAGNILLVSGRDKHGQEHPTVKISDFGISSELRGMSSIRPNVVHHAIMAPEIISTGYTSKQSDIYQVGLLLFWMLTGESAVPAGISYPQLMQSLSEGLPRQRAEAIGTPLGAFIARMLRRREQFRYASAREVWADLRALPAWAAEHT
ncbi:MAG TPA: serine/threonine-protein kinase [Polyangiaceae bacterium]|nr:serine/threonine-protein kinase [Polyangiaceae bacterium]